MPSRRAAAALGLLSAAAVALAPTATQNAVANGDTRSLSLYHSHTGESATVTFKVNGSYDSAALEKLNWITRDWRRDEPIRMNPRLFDVIWEVYRMSGSRSPIKIMSAYRSPQTNAMLRRRSSAVAKHSQHMQGNAMDVHFEDVSMARAREMGIRLQRGGVGYYPSANSPFVHLDVGSVRHWPKMSYDQLARIFPDGKTVHIPSNGQPLSGYDAALAEIERNGGTAYASAYVTSQKSKGLLAFLFGGGEEEEEEVAVSPRGRGKRGQAVAQRGRPSDGRFDVAASSSGDDAGTKTFFNGGARQAPSADNPSPAVQRALRNLPRGEAVVRPAEPEKKPVESKPVETTIAEAAKPVAAPTPPTRPTQVASLEPVAPAAEAETPARGAKPDTGRGEPKVADVPTPPRRPSALMIAELGFANVPLPPARPIEMAALRGAASDAARPAIDRPTRDLIAAKLAAVDRAALPSVITQGAATRSVHAALAYAGEPAPMPAPRPKDAAFSRPDLPKAPAPDFVAARVDRSNFRALTASAPATRTTTQAVLGPTVAPVRQAARANVNAMMMRSSVDVVSTFGDRPTGDLIPSRFTGPAVRAIPSPDTFGGLPAAPPAD